MTASRVLSVRFPAETHASLLVHSRLTNASMNSVVVRAVDAYLTSRVAEEAVEAVLEEVRATIRESVKRYNESRRSD